MKMEESVNQAGPLLNHGGPPSKTEFFRARITRQCLNGKPSGIEDTRLNNKK